MVMATRKPDSFATVIRSRRLQLRFTQRRVARLVKVSPSYVSQLEAGRRQPSSDVVYRLAKQLRLDSRRLMIVVDPNIAGMVSGDERRELRSAWQQLQEDRQLRRLYRISAQEMDVLARVDMMGGVGGTRDFIYILTALRNALAEE